MVNTRKFANEEQKILENFVKSNQVIELINDKIYDTEKCRQWVNENSKINDALSKYLNFKTKYSLDYKDKFLWLLSDIINCQSDEKASPYHKQINNSANLKNLLILLGICAEINEIQNIISDDLIKNNKYLEEIAKMCLDHYSLEKKNFIPSNRLNSILKEINKYNNNFTSNLYNDSEIEEDIDDLISYIEEKKIPYDFIELEEEKFENRGIKRKYEEDIDENNNDNDEYPTKKLVKDEKICYPATILPFNLECIGESIPSSDSE
ncbi:hypothetical protein [Rickettsia endosymbiont of Rhinocyllus conicus]|uniref:hypothetical protein n=1 Tax=Rickettsia endosymbiont of Rhinocyllus conicus TaxID=3066252 RepID=UPI003132B7AD